MLILVVFLGFCLRAYKLNSYPIHLGHDEISQLYDAISIARTGKDIYGLNYPFIFRSIYDYKPPFYTYFTVPFYFLIGWNEILIKIPGLLFGVAVIPSLYYFVLQLTRKKLIALYSALFTAITPFEIFYSRKSFENQAGITILLLGFGFIINSFKSHNKRKQTFGFILLGLSMYTYFSHVLIVPLLLSFFLYVYRKELIGITKKGLLIFILSVLPLFILIVTDTDSINRIRAVSLVQDTQIDGKLSRFYSEGGNITNYKRLIVLTGVVVEKTFNYFKPTYLFLNGIDLTNRDYIDVGLFYPYQLVVLIAGIYFILKIEKDRKLKFIIFLWIILAVLPGSFSFNQFSPHRTILAYTLINIINGMGLYWFTKMVLKARLKRSVSYSLVIVFTAVNVFYFGYFWKIYTMDYPKEKSEYLYYPFEEVSRYMWQNFNNYDQIIVDTKFGKKEITYRSERIDNPAVLYYLAFYGKIDPLVLQKYVEGNEKTILDKIDIRPINWELDSQSKNSLLVVSPWSVDVQTLNHSIIRKTYKFFDGYDAYYIISP